jgi:hypothetical protein
MDCVNAEMTDLEQYTQGWFKVAYGKNIKRKDVTEWLIWAISDREEEGNDEDEIEEHTLHMGSMLRQSLTSGKGTIKSSSLTIDPVDSLMGACCGAL